MQAWREGVHLLLAHFDTNRAIQQSTSKQIKWRRFHNVLSQIRFRS